MLGSRSFYCQFHDINGLSIFEFQAKRQRDTMYDKGCTFISAKNAYKYYPKMKKVPYHGFDEFLKHFNSTYKHQQLTLFDI